MKLSKWKCLGKSVSLAFLLASTLSLHVNAVEFMNVNDIHNGMEGIAKTVEQGDTISTFKVKVLGIMKNRGPSGDLILAEFSGPLIDRSGGIAHGMSGSPVYIDGKLVGAVAYGWGFTRSHIGMITPIEQMVKLWNIPYTKNNPNPWKGEGQLFPLGTPFMAYGFDEAALSYMKEKLPDYQFETYDTAAGPSDDQIKPLEAGGSVAATLIDGDLKLGAIGTVTYVDGNRIVAFGHPYMQEGPSGYFMHNAYIFTIVNSEASSFKLGSIGANIGAITEDRGAGIAGVVGEQPNFIPMKITIVDEDMNVTRNAQVNVIKNKTLTPSLASTSVYNFLTKTMDRRGAGTSTVDYTIYTGNDKLTNYERKDMFYSSDAIALESIDDFYNVVDKLMNNSFVNYNINRIDVKVQVEDERKTAQIIDATANPIIVAPGDPIHITVNLHPYRGEDFKKELVFMVPKDQPMGPMTLEVRGGGVTPLPYLIEKQKYNLTDEVIRRLHVYKNFDAYFKRLKNMDTNNQIIVEILDNNVSAVDSGSKSSKAVAKLTSLGRRPSEGVDGLKKGTVDDAWDEVDTDKDRAVLLTNYVIKGDGQFNITVVPKEKRDKAIVALIESRKKAAKKEEKAKEAAETKENVFRKKMEEARQKVKAEGKNQTKGNDKIEVKDKDKNIADKTDKK